MKKIKSYLLSVVGIFICFILFTLYFIIGIVNAVDVVYYMWIYAAIVFGICDYYIEPINRKKYICRENIILLFILICISCFHALSKNLFSSNYSIYIEYMYVLTTIIIALYKVFKFNHNMLQSLNLNK